MRFVGDRIARVAELSRFGERVIVGNSKSLCDGSRYGWPLRLMDGSGVAVPLSAATGFFFFLGKGITWSNGFGKTAVVKIIN